MIPQSKKPLNNEEDIICKLPNELLTKILSLLPESDANRTRILSKRWKSLYALLPNVHLVMPFCWSFEQANKFHDFVDQTLAIRGNMAVEKFFLYCSKNCDYGRVYDLICAVVRCKVRVIELRFPADRYRVKFCWDLFKTCNTLVELTLKGEFVLDVPGDNLLFPFLKKLDLVSIVYACDQSAANLISGCPVLEELFVERQVIGRSDYLQRLNICSASLKRLRLSFAMCVSGDYEVVIDAPKLEYVNVLDVMLTYYYLTKPLCLNEAHIKIQATSDSESVTQFVTSISSVKILTLTDSTLMALCYIPDMPVFPNLVKFAIGNVLWGWSTLPRLLENMPNLEHITFLHGLLPFPHVQHSFDMRWNPPVEVPTCLRLKMKEIIIKNRETITQEEFTLIKYLLKQCKNLEILMINAHKIDHKRRDRLLNFPRGSNLCCIKLV
ncbi:F-box/RNI-like superfamily protein [Artemisia annua]|uniref:F-box/RNI-like superfamily protein n=1 Tax=Artemisia annua TaxID=35608 RepID=A0A2U1P5R3_ARTAN|nr:F-box/RNI-like superfamily protein [Artemisia annua]